MAIVTCAECGQVINEPNVPEKDRKPCPQCGSRARLFKVYVAESITAHGGLRIKARHGLTGKPFVEARVEDEVYRKEGKLVHRSMRVDRENDKYTETIVDKETNKVIHHCDEPLSQHKGHGTANFFLRLSRRGFTKRCRRGLAALRCSGAVRQRPVARAAAEGCRSGKVLGL